MALKCCWVDFDGSFGFQAHPRDRLCAPRDVKRHRLTAGEHDPLLKASATWALFERKPEAPREILRYSSAPKDSLRTLDVQ